MSLLKETYEYKKINNYPIYADVYKVNKDNCPVIIYIHGGGLIFGSRNDMPKKQIELYNSAGFTVVSIDYRLAPETKLPYIIQDIRDAVEWIKHEGPNLFGINPNKVAVIGGSAGGYLALMTGTFEEKPNAIVSFYGYGDILGNWALTPSKDYLKRHIVTKNEAYSSVGNSIICDGKIQRFLFYLYCRQQGNWISEVTGCDLIFDKKQLERFCPVKNITNKYPATLLIHGDKDTDVPYDQSVYMNNELCSHGVNSKLITVKDGIHAFDYEMDNLEAIEAIQSAIEFLKKALAC